MKFFSVNNKETSFFLPVLKLVIAIILVASPIIFVIYFLNTNYVLIEIFCKLLGGIIVCFGFFNIYVVIGELSCTTENRKKEKLKKYYENFEISFLSLDDIYLLLLNNDICDIDIILNDRTINLGCSSIYNKYTGKFSDKIYFVDKQEYKDYKTFKMVLGDFATPDKNTIKVIQIDGVSPVYYKKIKE